MHVIHRVLGNYFINVRVRIRVNHDREKAMPQYIACAPFSSLIPFLLSISSVKNCTHTRTHVRVASNNTTTPSLSLVCSCFNQQNVSLSAPAVATLLQPPSMCELSMRRNNVSSRLLILVWTKWLWQPPAQTDSLSSRTVTMFERIRNRYGGVVNARMYILVSTSDS